MWWGVRAPSSANPCVKIPNGPEQTADDMNGQTERAELAGTCLGDSAVTQKEMQISHCSFH